MGLCQEGSGSSGGFQAEGRRRNVLLRKRRVWAPPALAPRGMRPVGQRNNGLGRFQTPLPAEVSRDCFLP